MTVKEQIMKLQTYKMFENEDTVYVERDDVLKALEQQPCDVTDINVGDMISRQAVLDIINFEDEWLYDANGHNADTKIAFSGLKSNVKDLPSVTPKADVLDKIRAEIVDLRSRQNVGVLECLDIIDKYKEESEVQ